jgi:flagella basal body P-ring formation protein FlgA
MSRRARFRPLLGLVVLATVGAAQAASGEPATAEPAEAVFDAVQSALRPDARASIDVKIATPDAARAAIAREKKCTAPLAVQVQGAGAYRTASVSCTSPNWTLYIGVTTNEIVAVPVATHAIPMGAVIADNDFKLVELPRSGLIGPAIDPGQLAGMRTSVPLSAGTAITRNSVVVATAIQNGQDVRAEIDEGDVVVRFRCRTLQSGAVGDTILAMNSTTGKRIEVYIARAGGSHPTGQAFITVN